MKSFFDLILTFFALLVFPNTKVYNISVIGNLKNIFPIKVKTKFPIKVIQVSS